MRFFLGFPKQSENLFYTFFGQKISLVCKFKKITNTIENILLKLDFDLSPEPFVLMMVVKLVLEIMLDKSSPPQCLKIQKKSHFLSNFEKAKFQ